MTIQFRSSSPRWLPLHAGVRLGLFLAALALLLPAGCSETKAPPTPPPPTFTGPRFLHGTIGSLSTLRDFEPMLVSGYGIVVNLKGTGSADVPAYLRDYLLNLMRKNGLGSPRLGTIEMSPERVLADPNKAIVRIDGIIPPGAKKGSRFDIRVVALPGTQTTSLEGGILWTADLGIDGANPSMRFFRPLAAAGGPIYLKPMDDGLTPDEQRQHQRQATVLSGGVVRVDRDLYLTLNQPSWQRAGSIRDRINERFPKNPSNLIDPLNTAIAKNDTIVELHVPDRYAPRPDEFVRLIGRLYLQRAEGFDVGQAQELGKLLESQPDHAADIALAWEGLGKPIIPILRSYYQHPTLPVRLAALEAGVRLSDELAADSLAIVAQHPVAENRKRAAELLVHLSKSMRAANILYTLVNDPDRNVRIAAYESLADMKDPGIQSMALGTRGNFKFILDLVPAQKPLIYINQADVPRVVVFNPEASFKLPLLARLWDNHLILRGKEREQPIDVFHQVSGEAGVTHQIAPTVANLIFLMAHKQSVENPTPGLDLSYSRVIGALYALCKTGAIDAELELQTNPLADAIAKINAGGGQKIRPDVESNPVDATQPADGAAPATMPAGPGHLTATPPGAPGAGPAGNPGNPVPDTAVGPIPVPAP